MEPSYAIARLSPDGAKTASRQNLAIRLHRDRTDRAGWSWPKQIRLTKGIHPGHVDALALVDYVKKATCQDAAIALWRDRQDRIVRVQMGRENSEAGCVIQDGEVVAKLPADDGESAAHPNLAVGPDQD